MHVRLSVAIQHHPSRASLIPGLLERMGGLDVEVVEDPSPDEGLPSPWRCYHECLQRTPAWATHRLVIQDDTVPCNDFASAAVAAITARPDRPIALWVGGAPADACAAMRNATRERKSWIDLSPWQWFPCVASVWPAETVAQLLTWVEESPGHITRADDAVTARFLQARRIWPFATVPSLVEHPDVELSVIGRRAWAGRDKNRVACVPIGDRDPSSIQW